MKSLLYLFIALLFTFKSLGCVVPVAGAIHGYGSTICMGTTVTLTNDTTGGRWKSTDSLVASINATTGVITPHMPGADTILYILSDSCGADTVMLAITVSAKPSAVFYSSLNVGSYTTFSLSTGASFTAVTGTATWPSGTDTLYGVSAGTAICTLTNTAGCTVYDTVSVGNYPVVGIPTLGSTLHGCVGNTGTVTDSSTSGRWSSSNTTVASINPTTGALRELATGVALISYTVTRSGSTGWKCIMVSVDQVPTAITGANRLCRGDTIVLSTDNYWSVFSTTRLGVQWTTSDTLIARVPDSTTASIVLTAVQEGTVTLTATSLNSGCFTSVSLTVDTLPLLSNITGTTVLCSSTYTTLVETVPGGVWSSSNTSIGTVSSTGLVTGLIAGTDTIIYTYTNSCGAESKSTSITVNALPVVDAITGGSTLNIGSTITLADATTGGAWSSSAASIATVNSATGVVTGVALGNAVISYTVTNSSGCTNYTTELVDVVPPAGIEAVNANTPFSVFPNPAHGTVNIGWNNLSISNVAVAVTDLTGKTIINKTITGNATSAQIDISALKAGIYLVIINNDGQKYYSKIVVE